MLRIRKMTEADIEAVATVRVHGWQFAYAGLMPQPYLDAMSAEDNAARLREDIARGRGSVENIVAEGNGAVVGWACTGPCRDEDAGSGDGELYALYVLPEHLSTGVGRALLEEAVAQAASRGWPRLRLWVLKDNVRARRFYEIAGFEPDGGEESFEVGGVRVPEVRYALSLVL
jgi:ribosomal protein S18 acetylase RimI-like enzyme